MKKLFGILTLLFVMGILFSSCTKKEIVPAEDWGFEKIDLRGDEADDTSDEDPNESIDDGEGPTGDDDDGITDDDDDEDEDDGGAARSAEGG